jgi:hypothetical protein
MARNKLPEVRQERVVPPGNGGPPADYRVALDDSGNRFAVPGIGRITRLALIAGAVAAVLAVIGAVLNVSAVLYAYLVPYLFFLGLALGCLGVLMIQNLAGGYWGATIRRPLEASVRTLPLMTVLFLPILAGMSILYPWTQPGGMGNPAVPGFKEVYLSVPFFIVRAVIYWVVWLGLAYFLTRWSAERDRSGDPALTLKLRNWSAGGLVLLGLTGTFAAFDWIMSLEPSWSSSIYGAMVNMGWMLTGFAFVIALTCWAAPRKPFDEIITPNLLNKLGSLLLAFLMLWAYLSFSQLILMWAGNLPDEIIWYIERTQGAWFWLAMVVAFLHFVLPFCILIIRDFKRNPVILGLTAAWLVVVHYFDIYWITKPSFHNAGAYLGLMDIVLLVAIGGLWVAAFTWRLNSEPVIARYDPQLRAGLEAAHESH